MTGRVVRGGLSGLVLLAAAVLLLLPAPDGIAQGPMRAAGLVVFAVGLWATAIVPEVLTAIAFFLLAMLFEVAPAAVVFSGFASTALWLVFGGLFIGIAVQRTGLGDVLARSFLRAFGADYLTVLTGITSPASGCPSSCPR